MSFKGFERAFLRPIGKTVRRNAPLIGGALGTFVPGIGNIAGAALGSALGDVVKRGKLDAGGALRAGATGAAGASLAGVLRARLGLPSRAALAGADDLGIPTSMGTVAGGLGRVPILDSGALASEGAGHVLDGAARAGSALAKSGSWLARNQDLAKGVGSGLQAGASLYAGNQADRRAREQMDLEREQWEFARAERERKRRQEEEGDAAARPYAVSLMQLLMRRLGPPSGSYAASSAYGGG